MSTLSLHTLSDDQLNLLNRISIEIKDEFNDLIRKVHKETGHSIEWLTSSTLSRDPYLSALYKNCVHLAFVLEVVKMDKTIQTIVTSSRELQLALQTYFQKNNLTKKVGCCQSMVGRLKEVLRPSYHFVSNMVMSLMMLVSADRSFSQKIDLLEGLTLVDTFVSKDNLKDGSWNDRYYPGLLDPLNEKERKTIYYVPHINGIKAYGGIHRRLRKMDKRFLFKADFFSLKDYCFALLGGMRIKKISFSSFTFRGVDVAPLFEADFRINRNNPSSFHGLLNYRFVRQLKAHGLKLRLVIEWFENQVIDRGFIKGLRQYYPETQVIGYQGYIVSRDHNLHLDPTDYEISAGIIPNTISVTGVAVKKMLEENNQGFEVKVAPSFRSFHIFDQNEQEYPAVNKKKLVVLPIGIGECADIMFLIGQLTKSYVDKNKFVIKPHPCLDIKKLNKKLGEYSLENFTITSAPIQHCFSKADCVISNTSSVCVEALCYGLPVIIIVNRHGITQNPIPKSISPMMWEVCYSAEDILKTFNKFSKNRNKQMIKEYCREIKQEYFEPVTPDGIRRFLNIN